MGIGLFGKLPQRADFIALNLPPTILHPMERWLQAGVGQSRAALGERWLDIYLISPIWRFWIGREVFGQGCCGALMPSVDAVGRYFPLLMLAWNADGSVPPPPLHDPADAWYEGVEARLLSVLQTEKLSDLGVLTAGLAAPASLPGTPSATQSYWWQGGGEIAARNGLPPPEFYAELLQPAAV